MTKIQIMFLMALLGQLVLFQSGFSQNGSSNFVGKREIDTTAINAWVSLGEANLSNDGLFFYYKIENDPFKSETIVLENVKSGEKREYPGASSCFFTADSKRAIIKSGDSLLFISLINYQSNSISRVRAYKYSSSKSRQWLAYEVKDTSNILVLLNLEDGNLEKFDSIADFNFDSRGKYLFLKKYGNGREESTIEYFDLYEKHLNPILQAEKGKSIDIYTFDDRFEQLAFVVSDKKANLGIWYYSFNVRKCIPIVDNKSSGIEGDFRIVGSPRFSENGRWIFFGVKEINFDTSAISDVPKVDIWRYKDLLLQPEQIRRLKEPKRIFVAAISISGGSVTVLERDNTMLRTDPSQITGNYVVISDHKEEAAVPWWPYSDKPSFYLVSLLDGSSKVLKSNSNSIAYFSFSPSGRFLVYWDGQAKSYMSYNVLTAEFKNLTGKISVNFTNDVLRSTYSAPVAAVGGWYKDDESVLLYDNFDIWQVDPANKRHPICITNQYGSKNHIKLRIVYNKDEGNRDILYTVKDTILLTGFNNLNKFNGFFQKELYRKGDPKELTMGPYNYYTVESQKPHYYSLNGGMKPLKAKYSNVWVVKRQTASESPNFFYTTDFKTFAELTDIHPERGFNWLTAELINWTQFDGTISQGILYKPENFDPHKKYPIIFNFYEQLSYRLFEFPNPGLTGDNINIPWFVSRGYLVFTPDIHYKIASRSNKSVGEWAYNSVVSAARYLCRFPYVDGNKIGLQGHSFGGLETNYLVTHSHEFAAAAEVAGASDAISEYLSLSPLLSPIEHAEKEATMENLHEMYGASLWQRPDLYLRNSAVLHVDQATTPLLIMHNKLDNEIPWRQGVELFLALRRAGKRVWLLQYNGQGHYVSGESAQDYTTRLTEYFDYFLMGKRPPKWMVSESLENGGSAPAIHE